MGNEIDIEKGYFDRLYDWVYSLWPFLSSLRLLSQKTRQRDSDPTVAAVAVLAYTLKAYFLEGGALDD